jgi:chlorophyll(ide) b reductase
MMLTDLLLRDAPPSARRAFNALAEEPETVAAALAPRLRSLDGTSGGSLEFLTPPGALLRVAARGREMVAGGRFFDAEGRRVAAAGGAERYRSNGVRVQVPE